MGGMFQSAGAKKGHFGEARESSIWMERERNGDAQEMKEKATVAPKHNQKMIKLWSLCILAASGGYFGLSEGRCHWFQPCN